MATNSWAGADEGLRIVLSPVQLAAVIQGHTVTPAETTSGRLWNRLFGGLEMVGGAFELVGAAALFLTPEPTLATKAGGAVLAANGADNAVTGAAQLWSGRRNTTLMEQAARAAARSLGCSNDTAEKVGIAIDIAVPVLVAGGLGAARALSIRSGLIDLKTEEVAGGHTIQKHVGKSEAFLRNRLATEPLITGAGTFSNLYQAEKYVSRALATNAPTIRLWTTASNPKPLKLVYNAGEVVGVVIPRATGVLQKASRVRVVLKKTTLAQKVYFVLTAHPSL